MELFPEYQAAHNKHLDYYEEFLPHVFFGETLNEDLPTILTTGDEEKLRTIFNYLEFVMKIGDIDVQEIITTTILARLGDGAQRNWKSEDIEELEKMWKILNN